MEHGKYDSPGRKDFSQAAHVFLATQLQIIKNIHNKKASKEDGGIFKIRPVQTALRARSASDQLFPLKSRDL